LMLRRLAVFIGGFDLEAAEKVCGVEPVEDFEVIDLLGSLVEKSLASLEERDHGSRYRMLETIRDYANEKLQQDADEAAASAVRHCEHFFQMAKDAGRGLDSAEQGSWIRRFEDELDNIRGAVALAMSGGVDPVIAVKFCVALTGFWILRGYASEGRGLVRATLALPAIDATDLVKAYALYTGACLAEAQSDHAEACRMLESCLDLRRRLDRPLEIADTLSSLSVARLRAGDVVSAAAGEEEALKIYREHGERVAEATALHHLGQIAHHSGDDVQATAHLQLSLDLARDLQIPEVEGECQLLLGRCAFEARDYGAASRCLASSLEVCCNAADKRGMANAHWWLGKIDLAQGNLASARHLLGEAVGPFRSFEMWDELLGCLEDHAMLLQLEGAASLAVQVSALTSNMRERLNLVRAPRIEARWQAHLSALREGLTEVAYASEWRIGWDQLNVDDAIRLAQATPQPAG
jgi:tetratricopeptide (TPR) repeat protein